MKTGESLICTQLWYFGTCFAHCSYCFTIITHGAKENKGLLHLNADNNNWIRGSLKLEHSVTHSVFCFNVNKSTTYQITRNKVVVGKVSGDRKPLPPRNEETVLSKLFLKRQRRFPTTIRWLDPRNWKINKELISRELKTGFNTVKTRCILILFWNLNHNA